MQSNDMSTVLLSFMLVTVIGSIIAYTLQHRNWIRQQQVSNHEKKVADLEKIFFDMDATFSKRLYWTRRLLYALRRYSEKKLDRTLAEYDKAITEWNEKRHSFQIRLAAIVGVDAWQNFEHCIAHQYVQIGAELETLARRAQEKGDAPKDVSRINAIEQQLNLLSHSVYDFVRKIYQAIQRTEEQFYSLARHKRLPKNEDELTLVSSWFLIKALFVPPRQFIEEP